MKTFITFLVVICAVAVYSMSDEEKAKKREEIEACIVESKVDKEILKAIEEHQPFTPTPELGCFSSCVLIKNGVMNPDGTPTDQPTDSEAAKECKKLTGKDTCETGGKIMECYAKNNLIPRT